MNKIDNLLKEYKVLTELVAEAAKDDGKAEAVARGNQQISVITRQLWNLGISPAQIQRLVNA